MSQEANSGYKGEALSALKKAGCQVGDVIRVTAGGKAYEGILIPRSETGDDKHVVVKLKSGYNVGVQVTPDLDKVKILVIPYEASEGQEIFISAEDPENSILIGYLRLRIPSAKAHRPEIKAGSAAIVRELHVYGPLVPVGKHLARAWQHKGYGTVLLSEAERVAREDYDLKKLLVISALGTKQYYVRLGYERDGVYVSKKLEN